MAKVTRVPELNRKYGNACVTARFPGAVQFSSEGARLTVANANL